MKKKLVYMVIILCFLFLFTGCKINVTKKERQGSDVETEEPIKIVVAKEHEPQLSDPENQLEIESASRAINKLHSESEFKENTITLVPMKGMYIHNERILITVCSFVNRAPEPICELHGDVRLSFKELDAEIAKMTIDFDEQFLGEINPDEALLVHLRIPVRGLNEDADFSNLDFNAAFENVRVAYVEK